MIKFLKAISLVLAMAIFCLPLTAVADEGGYGSNSGNLRDTIVGKSSPYVVTNTDLSGATGTTSNGTTTWGLYDSGEADHGMVYVIKSAGWSAISDGKTGITYTYNDKQYTLFDEPIEPESYYIFSYDHKSFPVEGVSSLNDGGRFTIAPTVKTYASGKDYRDIPPRFR